MSIRSRACALVIVLLLSVLPLFAEESSPPCIVVHAEGAVERLLESGETELLEIGHDAAIDDRVALGQGAVLSIVSVEGEDAGRVVKLLGPATGTLGELLKAASGAKSVGAIEDRLLDAFRSPLPETLAGPGITRAAEKGPLRPVFPAGQVAGSVDTFVFVAGLDDLEGGHLELRLFDKDPEKGGKPIFTKPVKESPAELGTSLPSLALKKRHWWQVSAVMDGEDVMAGEPVRFIVVKSPVGNDFPPEGFDTPEARGCWHLLRARAFQKARLYLDAYLEYGNLAAAGGGSSAIEKQQKKIEKKLGFDEDDRGAVADLVTLLNDDQDVLRLKDGRELSGRVVSEASDSVVFNSRGTRCRVLRSIIAEIRPAARPKRASAAPFVTVTSKRYIVSTNAGREYAKEATRHLEAFFDAFAATFGRGLGARRAKNLKAKIYRDETDFRAYVKQECARNDSVGGFYDTADTTLYLFRRFHEGEEITWRTLFHEGAHQILHIVCNEDPDTVQMSHYWLAEAIPCYLESLTWKGKRLVVGEPNPLRVAHFERMAKGGKLRTLPDLFGRPQAHFGSAELYDQGHAVFWYLMHAEKGKHRPALYKFAKTVFQNRPRKGLEEKAFRRPLSEVASEYEDWFLARRWK